MDTRQQIRNKAAAFLDEIREGVAKKIQEPGKGFDFARYVMKWDKQHQCGTVCCMEGWVPAIRPDIATWAVAHTFDDDELGAPYMACNIGHKSGYPGFRPHKAGIPISVSMWQALTLGGWQFLIGEGLISPNASFPDVAALWERVAARIRVGELDEHLLID